MSTKFTVGLTSCRRSQHDLNFTVGYDGRHASYSISSDFRGYQELGDGNSDGDAGGRDEGFEGGGGEGGDLEADDGTDYE